MRKIAQILDSHFVKIANKKSVDKSKILWYNTDRKKERDPGERRRQRRGRAGRGLKKKEKEIKKMKFYGYYEKTGTISEEKFNDFSEVEEWAANWFGCYDTDYLFALDEDEVDDEDF